MSQRATLTRRAGMTRTAPILLGGRICRARKSLAHRALEFLRGLEARGAPARHVHGLSGTRVLALARLAAAHREGAEAHQGDRLAALERAAHRGEERA